MKKPAPKEARKAGNHQPFYSPQSERRRLWYAAMLEDARGVTVLIVFLLVGIFWIAMKAVTPFVTDWLPIPILALALWAIIYRMIFVAWAVRLRPLIRKRLGGEGKSIDAADRPT